MFTALIGTTAQATERKYGLAGCGLGSIVFGNKGNQSSAAISNSTGVQTVGISLGTSNCIPSGKGTALDEREQEDFFVTNFASLSKEAAQGQGETLIAFASILGCSPAVAGGVAGQMRDDYGQIFSQPGAVAAFDAARDSLRADKQLSTECVKL